MVKIEIVEHRKVIPDLVDMYNRVFSGNISIQRWEWKHLQNPLNSPQPQVVVALDGGQIVGARPLMLANARAGNEILLAGQPCDTMVRPEYRRQGIFSKMNDLAIEQARTMGVSLLYNFPNLFTLAGNLKQGWQRVMPLESLMRFEKPLRVAEAKLGRGLASKVAGTAYEMLFSEISRRVYWPNEHDYRIETSDEARKELDALEKLYQEGKIELERSREYFEWRVDRHPEHKYRYVMCFEREDLVGYVLVGLSTWRNGLRVGQIADYMVEGRSADCICPMFDRAVVELLGMGCDMLRTWAPADEAVCSVLKRSLGFRSSFDFPLRLAFRREPDWLVARELGACLPDSLCIHDRDAWRLTPMFFDLA